MNQCTKWITKLPIVLDAMPGYKHQNISHESMYKLDDKVAHSSKTQGISSNITPKI